MQEAIINAGLFGILLPAVVAGLILLAAWRPWDDEPTEAVRWAAPLAIGLGYIVAHVGLGAKPESLPYLVGGITVVGLVEAFSPEKRPLHWVLRVAAVPLLLWFVAGFMYENYWSTTQAILWTGGLTAVFAAMAGSIDTIAERHPGATGPLVMLMTGTGGALVLALNNTARVGQMLGGLTAVAGAAVALTLWKGRASVSRGGVAVFTLIFAAVFASGYFGLFEQPLAASAVLLAAPHALWLAELGPLAKIEGWKGTAARVALVALAVAAAVGLAYMSGVAGGGDDYPY